MENNFKKVDYVFHLAALADIVPSIKDPKKYFDTNVNGTVNVLEASKLYNVKNNIFRIIILLWFSKKLSYQRK